jgi:hypothetical protein
MHELFKVSQSWNLLFAKISALVFGVLVALSLSPIIAEPFAAPLKLTGIIGLIFVVSHCETVTRYLGACITNDKSCDLWKGICQASQIAIQLLLLVGSILFIIGSAL